MVLVATPSLPTISAFSISITSISGVFINAFKSVELILPEMVRSVTEAASSPRSSSKVPGVVTSTAFFNACD